MPLGKGGFGHYEYESPRFSRCYLDFNTLVIVIYRLSRLIFF